MMDMETTRFVMAANSLELVMNSDHFTLSGADKVMHYYPEYKTVHLVSALYRVISNDLEPADAEWQVLMGLVGEIRRNGYGYEADCIKTFMLPDLRPRLLREVYIATTMSLQPEVLRNWEVYDMAFHGEHVPSCRRLNPLDGFTFEVGPDGYIQKNNCENLHHYFLKKMTMLPLDGRVSRQRANGLLFLMTVTQSWGGMHDLQWAINQVHKDWRNDKGFMNAFVVGSHSFVGG